MFIDYYDNENIDSLVHHYNYIESHNKLAFSDKPEWRNYAFDNKFHLVLNVYQGHSGCRIRLDQYPEMKNSVSVKRVEVISNKGNDIVFDGLKKITGPVEFGTRTHKELRRLCHGCPVN